ncbi:DEP domain-containing protein 1A-like [Acipenser oxyrinchus oxyrinchus]|uniref:DEP domain-containing protein 1A-like n=1 Tax=Acipenser oxyrinchus oxyrinchus TaxID=40147 RepID=A0AAD8DAX5_ACIOX|nr:DEP domain-containing protein 1A-like [Acipenser oxyrinchus oxyrinchus]
MSFPESRIVTPGPYRATKLWNEVTKLFRGGMPLKKHRQHFRVYVSCFTAASAVDWLHELLKNNSNFGPEVTRQQTVQLLRKFLKNHVIEDVKGRWGSETLEDNGQLYRFPPTSPLKAIPNRPLLARKKSVNGLIKDTDGFFKFPHLKRKSSKKYEDQELWENTEPVSKAEPMEVAEKVPQVHRREITQEDIDDVWRNITLTHLQKTLGLTSLEEVVDPAQVNPHHIVYNMTNVNKHGVVTLQDKSGDLPHWVLSAMKCLANWPKYDTSQPSYPGFERDVFKTVSDYFLNLPQPLLAFEFYELFVNILVLCGYITAPKTRQGKRKNKDEPCCPRPSKTQNLSNVITFKSTECLLLSLVCKGPLEDNQSPQHDEVFSDETGTREQMLQKGYARRIQQNNAASRRASDTMGGSCQNLSAFPMPARFRKRCYSLEGIMDVSVEGPSRDNSQCLLFQSEGNLASTKPNSYSMIDSSSDAVSTVSSISSCTSDGCQKDDLPCNGQSTTPCMLSQGFQTVTRPLINRLASIGNSLNIGQLNERTGSCFSINVPVAEITMKPDFSSNIELRRPSLAASRKDDCISSKYAAMNRRCLSTLELSRNSSTTASSLSSFARSVNADESLLQPHLERVAIEALQLCTLLLPPANRRKLQLLMRMISRMSQNVDMPRLHDAIGTRTLMVQTFSRCVLCCEEEVDLDELLATRLVSFLMDHHQEILQVPVYLQNAVQDHIDYLKKVQITYPETGVSATLPMYSFCRQISTQEFEQQKLSASQAAIADLLESLLKDKNLSIKDKKKKLKQFQKEYPEIYHNRFPTTESEAQLFVDKPKIKPPMLIAMKKPKILGMRN